MVSWLHRLPLRKNGNLVASGDWDSVAQLWKLAGHSNAEGELGRSKGGAHEIRREWKEQPPERSEQKHCGKDAWRRKVEPELQLEHTLPRYRGRPRQQSNSTTTVEQMTRVPVNSPL